MVKKQCGMPRERLVSLVAAERVKAGHPAKATPPVPTATRSLFHYTIPVQPAVITHFCNALYLAAPHTLLIS